MSRLACEFCGSKIGVRACYSCGTLVCQDCAAQVPTKNVLCKECASNPLKEEEEEAELEEAAEVK
jgi:ribosomal protein L40E